MESCVDKSKAMKKSMKELEVILKTKTKEIENLKNELETTRMDDEKKIQTLEKEKEVLSTKLDNIRKGLRQDMENQDQMYKNKLRQVKTPIYLGATQNVYRI